jgi:flagellar biosynthesis protein FliR
MILNNKPKAEKQPANYALNLKKKVRSATLVGVLLVFLAIIGFINAAIHKMEILIVPSVIALICGLLLIALSAAVMKRT